MMAHCANLNGVNYTSAHPPLSILYHIVGPSNARRRAELAWRIVASIRESCVGRTIHDANVTKLCLALNCWSILEGQRFFLHAFIGWKVWKNASFLAVTRTRGKFRTYGIDYLKCLFTRTIGFASLSSMVQVSRTNG